MHSMYNYIHICIYMYVSYIYISVYTSIYIYTYEISLFVLTCLKYLNFHVSSVQNPSLIPIYWLFFFRDSSIGSL